ncbi:TWiK family of potassium channels protein 18-like isoform X3 [Pollicipes pollicipes]|nr:TWiK family of potassium channels protein 18-like isoform X3 [Pollicipes pollicipes]
MFTQVGVGALVIGYAILGAVAFISIETNALDTLIANVTAKRQTVAVQLWNVTRHIQFNRARWDLESQLILKTYQDNVVQAIKGGYDTRSAQRWTFPGALMFCLSVFTMIGFGNIVPRSPWGKIATMCYALIGIPLYILYFLNMGEVFAKTFKWIYTHIYRCTEERERRARLAKMEIDVEALGAEAFQEQQIQVIVPTTACIYVLIGYLAGGTIMFAEWEDWGYLDSCYFSFTSILKIGFGDFFPGANVRDSNQGNQLKLVINFMYLLVGMGLLAMCYYLMKEEVVLKMREIKKSVLKRLLSCCGRIWGREDKSNFKNFHNADGTSVHSRGRKSVRRR